MNDYASVEIFEGKSLSDLFKEIYDNSAAKKKQIADLISGLSPLIQGIGDATILVPLIKEYLEIGVKNDEQLVKLAQIVQRMSGGPKQASNSDDFWADFSAALKDDQANAQAIEETKDIAKDVCQPAS